MYMNIITQYDRKYNAQTVIFTTNEQIQQLIQNIALNIN